MRIYSDGEKKTVNKISSVDVKSTELKQTLSETGKLILTSVIVREQVFQHDMTVSQKIVQVEIIMLDKINLTKDEDNTAFGNVREV